jgi:hypothetical protein
MTTIRPTRARTFAGVAGKTYLVWVTHNLSQ